MSKKQTFSSTDIGEIEDWLDRVGASFNITFHESELREITTFGKLCDHITAKVPLEHVDDCTTQQAFYKLRRAISSSLQYSDVKPTTTLTEVLPRGQRRKRLMKVEAALGHKLPILEPPAIILIVLYLLLVASPICFRIDWRIGLSALLLSIGGFYLTTKLNKRLVVMTIGELAEKMACEHYMAVRRDPSTINMREIPKLLTTWASKDFAIKRALLTKDADVR